MLTDWTPVGRAGWTIRRTGPRTAQAANRYGWNDNALRYDDGWIVYDHPERVPLYVRRAVARLFAEG